MYRFYFAFSLYYYFSSIFLPLSSAMLVQLISRDMCNCMQIFLCFLPRFKCGCDFFSLVDAIEWVFVSFGCLNDVTHKKRTRICKNFNEIFLSGILVCLISILCIINMHCRINISKIVHVAWEIISSFFIGLLCSSRLIDKSIEHYRYVLRQWILDSGAMAIAI